MLILREARWIADNLPNVRWIQIDDGFETNAHIDQTLFANLSGHWREEDAWDRVRFPRGMRAVADDIRALGLRPMIWFSPSCLQQSELFKAHPEYFMPNSNLHFAEDLVFADFSQPEVRDLIRRVLDRLIIEWGFEGIKLDFWTYGFEQTRMQLSSEQSTNHEWLQWLEREIRMRLPTDGMMLSCLEPANGNPFRSAVWDQHRIGPDIDGVSAEIIEEIAIWMAALVGLKQTQRHFWVPDSDGLSLYRFTSLPDESWRLFTTYMVATGSASELSGKLSEQTDDERMPTFRRAVALVRMGQRVTCPGYDWTDNRGRAPFVWVRHDDDGQKVIGLTNWSDSVQALTISDLPPGATLTNVFTGETATLPLTRNIAAHDAELWHFHL